MVSKLLGITNCPGRPGLAVGCDEPGWLPGRFVLLPP